MVPPMSDDVSFANYGPAPGSDDGIGVRFPPGLGLVPPRDVPRIRNKARMATDVAA